MEETGPRRWALEAALLGGRGRQALMAHKPRPGDGSTEIPDQISQQAITAQLRAMEVCDYACGRWRDYSRAAPAGDGSKDRAAFEAGKWSRPVAIRECTRRGRPRAMGANDWSLRAMEVTRAPTGDWRDTCPGSRRKAMEARRVWSRRAFAA